MDKFLEQIKKERKETTLGEVITFHRGYDLPLTEIKKGEYPVVFSNGRREFHNEFKVRGPGVFTGRSGSLGGIFYVEEDYWPHNTTLYVSDFHGNDPKFCYYFLSSFDFEKFNSGTGVPTLNRNHIHGMQVKIPNVQYQKKIAAILSSYDEKIQNNNSIIKNLEAIAQAIFDEWFVKFNFPGHEKVGLVESEMGEIPEGWRVGKVSDFGNVVCGKTPSKSEPSYFGGDIFFIKIPDMHGQVFIIKTEDSLTEAGASTQKNKLVPEGSICVSCIATVGLVSITTKDSQTNQQINTVIPNGKSLLEFLYFSLVSKKSDLQAIGSGGSTTLNVNTNIFSNIKVLEPTGAIINLFHKRVASLFEEIKRLIKEVELLEQSRDLLSVKLI